MLQVLLLADYMAMGVVVFKLCLGGNVWGVVAKTGL